VLLLAGSAFLPWLGLTLLCRAHGIVSLPDAAQRLGGVDRGAFGSAFLTCLLNPKAYLFTLAVFPQFMRIERGALVAQAMVMGAIVATVQTLVYGAVAIGVSRIRGWLTAHPARLAGAARAIGAGFLAIAVWTVIHVWRTP
jgi:threonine/homoserine/homoserine lactone efflux protein